MTKGEIKKLERDIELLAASILHWEDNKDRLRNVDRDREIEIGADACALCEEYLLGQLSCYKCPIRKETKATGCKNTPYQSIVYSLEKDSCYPINFALTDKLIDQEIKFLTDLRNKLRNRLKS